MRPSACPLMSSSDCHDLSWISCDIDDGDGDLVGRLSDPNGVGELPVDLGTSSERLPSESEMWIMPPRDFRSKYDR
jgi:hypothetical protein